MAILLNWEEKLWNKLGNPLFTWKSKTRLIGIVRMIPIHYVSPSRNSRKHFKKSWDHCFCGHLEIVILSFDLCWQGLNFIFSKEENLPTSIYKWRGVEIFGRNKKNIIVASHYLRYPHTYETSFLVKVPIV